MMTFSVFNLELEMLVASLLVFFQGIGARVISNTEIESFSLSECGHVMDGETRGGRVLGGESVELGEFPWITSIQSSDGHHFCAGFMINSRFLISAAHCFCKDYNSFLQYNADKSVIVESMKVKLSRVNLSDADHPDKVKDVKQVIMHHGFDKNLNNDIAIVELKNEVQWDKRSLSPICLPNLPNQDHEHGNVTVAGWGYRQCDLISHPSNELHKITVPLWTAEDCKKKYETDNYKFDREHFICAGSEDKDISKGDSGGPLMFMSAEKRWTAIGIVSSGKFMCSDKVPGVYTKISSYLEWINSNTK